MTKTMIALIALTSLGFSSAQAADSYYCEAKSYSGNWQFIVWGSDLDKLTLQINKKNSNGKFEEDSKFSLGSRNPFAKDLMLYGSDIEKMPSNLKKALFPNGYVDDGVPNVISQASYSKNGALGLGWKVDVRLYENEYGVLVLYIKRAKGGWFGSEIKSAVTNRDTGEQCRGPTL